MTIGARGARAATYRLMWGEDGGVHTCHARKTAAA